MTDLTDEQQRIVDWFDATYRRKGERYLRPLRAYYVFLELLAVKPDTRLLDVACGLGRLLEAAATYGVTGTGIDISPVAIAAAQNKLPDANLVVGNAEQLPFADASFDVVTCLGSLERMMDRPQVLREMKRVGSANARFCLLVRNSATLGFRWLTGTHRLRRRRGHQDADSLSAWRTLFEDTGFETLDVLPDQYPLHRKAHWRKLGLGQVDFHAPIRTTTPLEGANEFVFVLRST
ncbi:MAG: class I SAM-dependent methyltransferase [Pseudomonadota bacterium]